MVMAATTVISTFWRWHSSVPGMETNTHDGMRASVAANTRTGMFASNHKRSSMAELAGCSVARAEIFLSLTPHLLGQVSPAENNVAVFYSNLRTENQLDPFRSLAAKHQRHTQTYAHMQSMG